MFTLRRCVLWRQDPTITPRLHIWNKSLFRCCSLIITRLTCSLCGFAFHSIEWRHNYNTIRRFAVFRPVTFFTSSPRVRLRVSLSRRDWDYDCTFRRVSIMVLRSLWGFAFHGVETPCLHSSNKHLTVVTKIKTSYRINTTSCFFVTSWLRLRLRVSSRLFYGFTCSLCVPWRREPMITTRLHHRINNLPVLCPFVVFCSVARLL